MGERMTPTLDGKLRCLQSLLQQLGANVACEAVAEARDALVSAHLTQPAQAVERTCSDERQCINCYADQGECLGPYKAARPVDMAAIREVIATLRACTNNDATTYMADKLTAALPKDSNGAEGVGGWQTIETAPKDGTTILVPHQRHDGRIEVVTAHWNRDWVGADAPRHWMPLPDAPQEDTPDAAR